MNEAVIIGIAAKFWLSHLTTFFDNCSQWESITIGLRGSPHCPMWHSLQITHNQYSLSLNKYRFSFGSPTQFPFPGWPPTQVRLLLAIPLPHDTEHSAQSAQSSHLPPQTPGEHISVCAYDPTHLSFPDLWHFRVRLRVPLPQLTEHAFHEFHPIHCEHVGREHVWICWEFPWQTALPILP